MWSYSMTAVPNYRQKEHPVEQSTKDRLIGAAIDLTSEGRDRNISIRAIARKAGVTEGAIYRHFPGKDDLLQESYERIAAKLLEEKADLLERGGSFESLLRGWIRITLSFYDRNSAAFSYLLLRPPYPYGDGTGNLAIQQDMLVFELIRRGQCQRVVRNESAQIQRVMLDGLLVNIPRQIQMGQLKGHAMHYYGIVVDAAERLLMVNKGSQSLDERYPYPF
jgi:AcrR family transcriptional regulator